MSQQQQERQQQRAVFNQCGVLCKVLPIIAVSLLISFNTLHNFVHFDTATKTIAALTGGGGSIIRSAEKRRDDNDMIIKGIVINDYGIGIGHAKVIVEDFETKKVVRTSGTGTFAILIESSTISHAKIVVSADGYRTEIMHMVLSTLLLLRRRRHRHDENECVAEIDPIILPKHDPNAVRMLFGGDVSFGRKWIDPNYNYYYSSTQQGKKSTAKLQIPRDHPDALIQPSNPTPGTTKALLCLQPWFQEADFRSVSWESVVSNNPQRAPNTQKISTFFTLPESLKAMKDTLHVNHVALGNNHMYDYLQDGLKDTLYHMDQFNISHSGAGFNTSHAITPHRTTLSSQNTKYSFLSFTNGNNIMASENNNNEEETRFNIIATNDKGGAAGINHPNKDALYTTILQEQSRGYIPIPQLHVGIEYSSKPNKIVQTYMQTVTDLNAVPLVIMHHPHVAQGMAVLKHSTTATKNTKNRRKKSMYNKKTVVLMSLGNMAYDEDHHHESFLSILARIDMSSSTSTSSQNKTTTTQNKTTTTAAAATVDRVRLLPIYLENYAPKPIGGMLASRFIRHLSQKSHDYSGRLYPYNGMGYANLGKNRVDDTVRLVRSVIVDITIPPSPPSGSSEESSLVVVDLRKWIKMDESLLSWSFFTSPLYNNNTKNQFQKVQAGRDIYHFGDFEDYVIDASSSSSSSSSDVKRRSADDVIKARWDLGKYGKACTKTMDDDDDDDDDDDPSHVFRASNSLCSFIPLPSSSSSSSLSRNNNETNANTTTTTTTTTITTKIVNREKIRIEGALTTNPNKDLSLLGYVMGENAGSISIKTKYYANAVSSSKKLGEDVVQVFPQRNDDNNDNGDGGRTFDWMVFGMDLNMPKDVVKESTGTARNFQNARALKISMFHSVTTTTTSSSPQTENKETTTTTSSSSSNEDKNALVAFDEIAIVSWDQENILPGDELRVPHACDFLKVKGNSGSYKLKLTFVRHIPTAASVHISEEN